MQARPRQSRPDDAAWSYRPGARGLLPMTTGAAAPFAMEQMMFRSILKASACAAVILALFGCASTNSGPYQGTQGELPSAAGPSDVHPPYDSHRY